MDSSKANIKILKIIALIIAVDIAAFGFVIPFTKKQVAKAVFSDLATEDLFPEYEELNEEEMRRLYGGLSFDYYVIDNSTNPEEHCVNVRFDLDFTTRVHLEKYNSAEDCGKAFRFKQNTHEDSGVYIVNNGDFKMYVKMKEISLLNFETDQTILVKNGTCLYEVTKYDFWFSQKDFRDSAMLIFRANRNDVVSSE